MTKKPKIIAVLPAYNAEKTLEKTINDIPKGSVDEIILVDDASNDKTVKLTKKLNLILHEHSFNMGYGANQKSCYKIALERKADIIVMLHPDYQYDPKLIPHLTDFIKNGYFDIMLGSRIRSRHESLAGGMPPYKYYSNRFLTFFQNLITGQNLGEWHTGMRAYSSKVLKNIPFKKFSNDFIFDTQMLLSAVKKGYKIGDIPVPVRYFPKASSINLKRSLKYGFLTLKETLKFKFS